MLFMIQKQLEQTKSDSFIWFNVRQYNNGKRLPSADAESESNEHAVVNYSPDEVTKLTRGYNKNYTRL